VVDVGDDGDVADVFHVVGDNFEVGHIPPFPGWAGNAVRKKRARYIAVESPGVNDSLSPDGEFPGLTGFCQMVRGSRYVEILLLLLSALVVVLDYE
jgi:hypothetical protein